MTSDGKGDYKVVIDQDQEANLGLSSSSQSPSTRSSFSAAGGQSTGGIRPQLSL